MEDGDVDWVAPDELALAARSVRKSVEERHPATKRVLDLYRKSCCGADPIEEEFARDLADIESIAHWAKSQGAARMTLDVNW